MFLTIKNKRKKEYISNVFYDDKSNEILNLNVLALAIRDEESNGQKKIDN